MANQFFKSLWVGLRRRWLVGLRNGFGAVGAAWTATEVATKAFSSLNSYVDTHGWDFFWLMVLFAAGAFVVHVFEPTHVTFKVPTTDTKVTLKFANLFDEPANLLIGVNEFFDGDLGPAVSKNSLHGQFITRNFGGNAANFRTTVDQALAATGAKPTATARPTQPSKAYPIGTTPHVPNGAYSAFLMAMARTDHATFKASSDVPTLWQALQGGLRAVVAHGNGEPLAMPLFGNGQSGINLTPQHLLRLLTLALVEFGRNSNTPLPKHVTVTLADRCFEELDIREIARDWKRA